MVGVPARQIGWMSEFGEQLDLPLTGETEAECPHTGCIYRLRKCVVSKIEQESSDGADVLFVKSKEF